MVEGNKSSFNLLCLVQGMMEKNENSTTKLDIKTQNFHRSQWGFVNFSTLDTNGGLFSNVDTIWIFLHYLS